MSAPAPLDDLIRELEDTATRLRAGDLEPAEAATLVDRCAELALQVGGGLDRVGREAERDLPDEGQEQLL
jgi:hypothetical protein